VPLLNCTKFVDFGHYFVKIKIFNFIQLKETKAMYEIMTSMCGTSKTLEILTSKSKVWALKLP
jgi:hypothetical protein